MKKAPPPPLQPKASASGKSLVLRKSELLLLAAILIIAVVLRLVALARSAVEHFDEGIYASNIFFPPPEYAYPAQRFYAPPLVPGLIEASMTAAMLAGWPLNLAALVPSAIAGAATVAALWWLGRSWLSPRAGLAAATLAALSPLHVAYSASALTDVVLGLWLVLAVDAAARSLARGDLRWAVGAGLYTGLAWWTKYNGWLPLAIEGAGLVLMAAAWRLAGGRQGAGAAENKPGRRLWTALGCFMTTAIVAAVVWSLYFLALQKTGGYGPIAANHARYVVGFSGWLHSAARQTASFTLLEGAWTSAAIAAAFVVAALGRPSLDQSDAGSLPVPSRAALIVWLALGAFLAAVSAGLVALLVLSALGMVVLAVAIYCKMRLDVVAASSRQAGGLAFGGCLLAAWWSGLLVATPCYWPYSRLLIPWLLAAWLATGALIDAWLVAWARRSSSPAEEGFPRGAARFVTGLLAALWLFSLLASRTARLDSRLVESVPTSRLSLRQVTQSIEADLASHRRQAGRASGDDNRVVYVFGEPALFFQLAAAGEPFVRPVNQIPTSPALASGEAIPTFLVVGPHARSDAAFRDGWKAAESEWELVGRYAYVPSKLVWLDLHDPRDGRTALQDHAFLLYAMRTPRSAGP